MVRISNQGQNQMLSLHESFIHTYIHMHACSVYIKYITKVLVKQRNSYGSYINPFLFLFCFVLNLLYF